MFLLPPRLMKSTPVNSMLYSKGSSSYWRPLGMAQSSAPPRLRHRWRSGWGRPRVWLQPQTPWQCCRPRSMPPVLTHGRPRNPSSESFFPINRGQWWVSAAQLLVFKNCSWQCSPFRLVIQILMMSVNWMCSQDRGDLSLSLFLANQSDTGQVWTSLRSCM